MADENINETDEVVEELLEMEIDEDDIYAYLFDEDDNEIGFVILNENGEEEEYFYANEDEYEYVEVEEEVSEDTTGEDEGVKKN